MLAPYQVDFLELLVRRGALRFGDFTLKSGRRSPYFINTGCFHQGGDLALLGTAYAGLLHDRHGDGIDAIFGPAYKGIPLALACASAYEGLIGRPVGWTYDRKEAKDHGDRGSFVGQELAGGVRLAIVDDVMTAGTAIRESMAKLLPLDVKPTAVVIAVDREERGRNHERATAEIAREFGVPVHAIVTISEAVDHLEAHEVSGFGRLSAADAARIREHVAGS